MSSRGRSGLPALPVLMMGSTRSGRLGRYAAVSARPTKGWSGWSICQPAANWFSYPRWRRTSQASSIETAFMRRRRSSETLGRPSGYRSPFQRGVNASRSALAAAMPLGRSGPAAIPLDRS